MLGPCHRPFLPAVGLPAAGLLACNLLVGLVAGWLTDRLAGWLACWLSLAGPAGLAGCGAKTLVFLDVRFQIFCFEVLR